MSKLNELYMQLEVIDEEIDDYIETSDNDAIVSDVAGKVKHALEKAIFELKCIVDDETAGIYRDDEKDDYLEEEEDF